MTGKEGKERIREVRALLVELPDYRNGPYGELRTSGAIILTSECPDSA